MVQLHLHDHVGSKLDAIASLEEYAEKAYNLGHKGLAATNHGSLSSNFELQQAANKFNLKPIFGIEMYIADQLVTTKSKARKEKRIREKNYHLILLAKNKIGYKNLLYLNYLSNKDEEHYYYVPRILLEELIKNKEGLIVLSGCMNSPINRNYLEGNIDKAKNIIELLKNEFNDDFYGEIHLNEIEEQKKANEFILENFNKIVLTGDVHYLNPGESQIQNLAIAIRNKQTIDELNFEIESKSLYYHDIKDYIKFNEEFNYNYSKSDIIKYTQNTMEVFDKCNYNIPERTKMYLPNIYEDDDMVLINKSKENLCKLFDVNNFNEVPKEYQDRLKKELEIVIRKGFSSYILILEDIFQFIEKEKLYKAPGRGSAAGSLILYVLNITTLDPIKNGLLFERFLSEERSIDYVCNYFYKE